MTRNTWVTILVCFAQILAHASDRMNYSKQLKLVPHGPIRLGYMKGISWAEYCPDETCDVIRTKRQIDREKLAGLALSYYFYASDYIYLRTWREEASLKKEVDSFLETEATSKCGGRANRERYVCTLKHLADLYQLEILFIRHDEEQIILQRYSRDKVIK